MTAVPFAFRPGYGWVMAGVTFTLTALSFGILGSAGIFLKPLAADFGWSRGALSLGYTAMTVATAFSAVFWGTLADRYGTRWIALFGACFMGISLFLLSQMNSMWEFYLYYLMFGALGQGALSGPLFANVGLWFSKNVGLAIGVAISGGAVGQGVVPMAARLLISNYDWQTAYLVLGVCYLAIGIPIALLVRNAPRPKGSDGSERPLMRDGKPFPLSPAMVVAWMASAVLFCCITMSVAIVHIVPLISDRGVAPEKAASFLLVLMVAGAFGRILGGKLADKIGPLQSYLTMSVAQTATVVFLPFVFNLPLMYALAIAFGLFYSGVMASFVIVPRFTIPPKYLARSMAMVSMFGWFGMGIGGWQGGLMYDLTGNYIFSFANAGIAGAINVTILLFFLAFIRRRSAALLQPA